MGMKINNCSRIQNPGKVLLNEVTASMRIQQFENRNAQVTKHKSNSRLREANVRGGVVMELCRRALYRYSKYPKRLPRLSLLRLVNGVQPLIALLSASHIPMESSQ